MSTQTGNLDIFSRENPGRKGWFIGHFLDSKSPFKTDDFEVNWVRVKKNEKKEGIGNDAKAKTLTILIEGLFKFEFLDKSESVILKNKGDYFFYEPIKNHISQALEDSLIMTIRWPSKR